MVLDRLGRGEPIEDALRSAYNLDYGELTRRWSEELERENRR